MVIQLIQNIILALCLVGASFSNAQSLSKPGCTDRCGNIIIPYPFGIGPTCSGHLSFTITCNTSFGYPRPFLTSINLEVLEISLYGTVHISSPVAKLNCYGNSHGKDVNLSDTRNVFSFSSTYSSSRMTYDIDVNLSSSVFTFSSIHNRFTATGCNNIALFSSRHSFIGGCISFCTLNRSFNLTSGCFGDFCCQTEIPPMLNNLNLSFARSKSIISPVDCKTAFIVAQDWFNSKIDLNELENMDHVPAVLEWNTNTACNSFDPLESVTRSSVVSLCGNNSFCSVIQRCECVHGYEGNPYLPEGCQGAGTGVGWLLLSAGLLPLSVAVWWLRKVIIKLKKNQLKKKSFKRNGGLLLQKQLSSGQTNIDKTKLFTSKELEKATDHYNKDRILGQGGQGTVYKGMLTDGKIVAIKKSRIEDEANIELFINEVVILSQINHRNVVKLHGFCLETEVPMLVYEFIPNGNLYQYIHDKKEDFPLTWEIRLRVAKEIAEALSYLHSATVKPVYHRDIKSTNILLDERFRAKVADFGTSRSIAIDQTHLTTRVHGTFGYLDPEYFRSSKFTEKSDVYSFGVVLVEILTGKRPITSTKSDEMLSLATYFIMAMKGKDLFNIVDARVVKEGRIEEILEFANLAKRCLNMNGRKRPTMKEVAMELEVIRKLYRTFITDKSLDKVNFNTGLVELYRACNAWSSHIGMCDTSNLSPKNA